MATRDDSKKYAATQKGKETAARKRAKLSQKRRDKKQQALTDRRARFDAAVLAGEEHARLHPKPTQAEYMANPEKYGAVQQFPPHLVDAHVLALLPLFGPLRLKTQKYVAGLLSKIKPFHTPIVERLAKDFASGRPIDKWLHVGDAPIDGGYWDAPDGAARSMNGPIERWVHEYWENRRREREVELLRCLRLLRDLSTQEPR